jgi:hypothetical protein
MAKADSDTMSSLSEAVTERCRGTGFAGPQAPPP